MMIDDKDKNFKTGSILVALCDTKSNYIEPNCHNQGDICEIENSGGQISEVVWFKADGKGAFLKDHWRLATEKEIEAFKNGIRNIKDIILDRDLPFSELEGRYLEVIEESSWGYKDVYRGQYYKIISETTDGYCIKVDGPLLRGVVCSKGRINDKELKLMPKGWSPAAKAQEEKATDYTGRYIKALFPNAWGTDCEEGDYLVCEKYPSSWFRIVNGKRQPHSFTIVIPTDSFRLMPEDFNPEKNFTPIPDSTIITDYNKDSELVDCKPLDTNNFKSVLDDKWYIEVRNQEEAKIYRKFFSARNGGINWSYFDGNHYGFDGNNYVTASVGTLLSFKEFCKRFGIIPDTSSLGVAVEKFQLPEKWCIGITNDNYDVLYSYWLKKKEPKFNGDFKHWLCSDDYTKDGSYMYWGTYAPYPIVTLNQLKNAGIIDVGNAVSSVFSSSEDKFIPIDPPSRIPTDYIYGGDLFPIDPSITIFEKPKTANKLEQAFDSPVLMSKKDKKKSQFKLIIK